MTAATEAPPVGLAAGEVHLGELLHNDRSRLKALTRIASTDGTRPVLQCIAIDHRGLWAIDGFHMGHVPAHTGLDEGDRRLIWASRLAQALNQATRKTDVVAVSLGDTMVRFEVMRHAARRTDRETLIALEVPYAQVDIDLWPNLDALLPADTDRTRPSPNEDMVQQFIATNRANVSVGFLANLADLGPAADDAVTLVPVKGEPDGVHLGLQLVYDASGRWLGVVMPRRYGVR